jgi:zinc and cadmium transporter
VSPTALLILYSVVIVLVSLVGGFLPSMLKLGHRSLQFLLSFVAGVMLGVGLFHMLPHAIMIRADAAAAAGVKDAHGHAVGHDLLDPIMLWVVAGFLALFLLERFFHFHHHEADGDPATGADASSPPEHVHGPGCGHGHEGHAQTAGFSSPINAVSWSGALVGLGLHSLFEGIALAASIAVGASGGHASLAIAGLATFLVIVLHKPFDAMTLATLMRRAGAPLRLRILANVFLALLVPAGVGLFWAGAAEGDAEVIAAYALAFSAGMFLCIASSDLLPELQFHRHDRVGLSLALVAGLIFAFALARLEAASHVHVGHDHHHHDHGSGHDHAH